VPCICAIQMSPMMLRPWPSMPLTAPSICLPSAPCHRCSIGFRWRQPGNRRRSRPNVSVRWMRYPAFRRRHCPRRSAQPLPLADHLAGARLQSARTLGPDLRRDLSLRARTAAILGNRAPGAEACAVVAQPFAASRSHGLRSGLSQSFCRQRKGPRTPASIPLPTAWRSGGGA